MMLAVFVARWVANHITADSPCKQMIKLQGYPLLEQEPPGDVDHIIAKDVMSAHVTVQVSATVAERIKSLQTTKNPAFVAVNPQGEFQGLITRKAILGALRGHVGYTIGYMSVAENLNTLWSKHSSEVVNLGSRFISSLQLR